MSSWSPTTMEGERIHLSCSDGGRRFDVNDAVAVEVDHVARNGVGHVIDKVRLKAIDIYSILFLIIS